MSDLRGRAPGPGERHRPPKPPVPLYWWPLWMFFLALALFIFYVVLTPVWIGIRLVAWLSERTRRSPPGHSRSSPAPERSPRP